MKAQDAPVSLLESLQYVLAESGYETDLIAADESTEHPYEELLVSYRGEDEPPPLAVRLLFSSELNSQFRPPNSAEPAADDDDLQLMVNLPFKPDSGQLQACEELLNHFNLKLPQGRFVLAEAEGLLFQDALPVLRSRLSPGLVAEALEMSGFLAGRYYPGFARLLQGESVERIVADFPLGV